MPGEDSKVREARRPNIVLILLDDMGYSDIGCYGGEVSTPNIDRLAQNGLRFTQFYNVARCCPTRASLLTGLYPHQAGIGHMTGDAGIPSYRGDLGRNCITFAEALRPAGYRTLMSGKWHVTPINGAHSPHNWPMKRGFERHYGTVQGCGSYWDPVTLMEDDILIAPEGEGYYYTDAVTDHAVQYIHEYAGKGAPFLLYAAYTAPHWPLHAFEEDIAANRERFRSGWDVLREERRERMIGMGIIDERWPLSPRDSSSQPWDETPAKEWEIERMAVYAAMISRVDRGVGRIMEAIRARDEEENTLVLFLSDNGGCHELIPPAMKASFIPECSPDGRPVRRANDPSVFPGPPDTYCMYGPCWANVSNTPFRLFKSWVHEGGISTPLIAYWPQSIQPGTMTHEVGHLIDLMPTFLELAGARYPAEFGGQALTALEGRSLLPVLLGGTREPHDYLFWEHEGNRVARKENMKLVSRYPGQWELYDLEHDRTELHDLAGRYPALEKDFRSRYDAWAARCGVQPWEEMIPKVWIPL